MSEVLNRLPVTEASSDVQSDMVSGEGVTWINVSPPSRRELQRLGQLYSFHRLDLDDCVSRIQLPKLDEYPDYLFIILHFPVWNRETRITTPTQVAIFLGKGFVVTAHAGALKPLGKLFQDCRENETTRNSCLGKDAGYLLYRIVDVLVDYCFPMLAKVLDKLERVEDRVFDEKASVAQEVAILRRDIAAQRRIFWPMKDVMANLEEKAQRFTEMDLKVYFGDINDHVHRIWDTLEEAKETVEIYKDSDFILSQDRLQRIVAILTIITATMLPFTIISSIFGMNVPLHGSAVTGSRVAGWLLIALMSSIAGALLYLFRRRRWF